MLYTKKPGSEVSTCQGDPSCLWYFPFTTPNDTTAVYAQGNMEKITVGGTTYFSPINGSSNYLIPYLDNGFLPSVFTFPLDQKYDTSFNPPITNLNSPYSFDADMPLSGTMLDEYSGDFDDIQSAIYSSGQIDAGPFPITKQDGKGGTTQLVYQDVTCTILPWVDTGSPGGGVLTCSGDQSTTDTATVTCAPTFSLRLKSTPGASFVQGVALMDGQGTIVVTSWDPINGKTTQTGVIGSDAAALAYIGSSLYGGDLPAGATGALTASLTGVADKVLVDKSTVSMPPYDGSTITGESEDPSQPDISLASIYAISGGTPPAPAGNIGGFVYPTPDNSAGFQGWTAPPTFARIPFQNYSFSVPNFVLKGK